MEPISEEQREIMLEFVAERLGLSLYTDDNFLHVLTDKSFSSMRYKILTSRLSGILSEFARLNMRSRTMSDHEDLIRKGA